ncbi:MAG: nitrile hydratase accessory protein [Gammaproteobacteria bacterium]|jgi:nitrile hydratase accessory protein
MALTNLEALPDLPLDENGPVFKAPWQAQAFALVVSLQEQGILSPEEWAEQLGTSIQQAREQGDPDLGDTYYEHWLSALETITFQKGLSSPEILAERKKRVHDEQQKMHGHDHEHGHGHGHDH